MRIELSQEAMASTDQSERLLVESFFHVLCSGDWPHAVVLDPPYDPSDEASAAVQWLATLSHASRAHFSQVLVQGPVLSMATPRTNGAKDKARAFPRWRRAPSLSIRVEKRATSDWAARVLSVADARDLLREPVHLFLENPRSDRAFLTALAGPTDGPRLRALLAKPGAIALHGGGGGEIQGLLNTLESADFGPELWRLILRAWVMFDTDAGDLDALVPSRAADRLMESCEKVAEQHELTWICLSRREIESYTPDDGLLVIATAAQQPVVKEVIAWRSRQDRAAWAWAFDLKKGLHGDKRGTLSAIDRAAIKEGRKDLEPQHLKSPFDTLSKPEVQLLSRGLNEKIAGAMQEEPPPPWIEGVPAEYDRGPHDQLPRTALIQSLFDRM